MRRTMNPNPKMQATPLWPLHVGRRSRTALSRCGCGRATSNHGSTGKVCKPSGALVPLELQGWTIALCERIWMTGAWWAKNAMKCCLEFMPARVRFCKLGANAPRKRIAGLLNARAYRRRGATPPMASTQSTTKAGTSASTLHTKTVAKTPEPAAKKLAANETAATTNAMLVKNMGVSVVIGGHPCQ